MCGREEDNLLDILMIVSEALPSIARRPQIKKRPGERSPGRASVDDVRRPG